MEPRPDTALGDGQRVCVIGAGSSGIASAQVLQARKAEDTPLSFRYRQLPPMEEPFS